MKVIKLIRKKKNKKDLSKLAKDIWNELEKKGSKKEKKYWVEGFIEGLNHKKNGIHSVIFKNKN